MPRVFGEGNVRRPFVGRIEIAPIGHGQPIIPIRAEDRFEPPKPDTETLTPPVAPPPGATGGQVAPPEAFAAWAQQQRKLTESRKTKGKRKPLRPLQQNLQVLQQEYLKPAGQMVLDAVYSTAMQFGEEALKRGLARLFRLPPSTGRVIVPRIQAAAERSSKEARARPGIRVMRLPTGQPNPLARPTPVRARPIPPAKPAKVKVPEKLKRRPAQIIQFRPTQAPRMTAGAKSAPLPGQLQPVTVTGKRSLTPVQVTGKRSTPTATPNPLTRSQTAAKPQTATRTATRTQTRTPTRTSTASRTPTWTSVIQRLATMTAPRLATRSPTRTLLRTAPLTSLQQQVLTSTQTVPQTLTRTQQKTCECKEERKKERKKRPPRTVCYRGTYTETARGIIKRRKERVSCPPSKSK